MLESSLKIVVLTGAGISTDSGIPDLEGRMVFGRKISFRRHQTFIITYTPQISEREIGHYELRESYGLTSNQT